MFDFKKNKFEPADSDSLNLDAVSENMPLHTMQDDLNAAQGISPSSKENLPPDVPGHPAGETVPAGGKNLNIPKYADTSKTYSPFLNPSAPISKPPDQNDSAIKKFSYSPKDEGQSPDQSHKKPLNWGKIFLISVSVLTVLLLVAGGYYFWITRKTAVPPSVSSPISNPPEEKPVIIENQGKFSPEKPNYLSIDIENSTPESIQQLFIQTASEIKESGISVPVEFVITDQNNNPIAFSIFSIFSGMKLSSVLDNFNEEFSLYIFLDSSAGEASQKNARLGLAINLKDEQTAVTAMSAKEKTIATDLLFLLLDNNILIAGGIFQDNTKDGVPIRYVNFSTGGSLSIDYAFTDGQLIIATSKNTMWAILDKIGQKN